MHISQLNARDIFPLRPDSKADAIAAASKNGADDVFFQIEDQLYVASGENFDTDALDIGSQVQYRGQTATVAFIDQEANSFTEGLKASLGSSAALGVGAGAVVGGTLGYFATGWSPGKTAAKAGLEIGVKIAAATSFASLTVGAAKAAANQPDYSVLHQFAQH